MNFASMQHHPIHLHGHTFWVTGHEGSRASKSAWIPRNNLIVGIAQATEFDFIANNRGDWSFHCHMVYHLMNHMTRQVGPRVGQNVSVDEYLPNSTFARVSMRYGKTQGCRRLTILKR